jgi:hypothetical protein
MPILAKMRWMKKRKKESDLKSIGRRNLAIVFFLVLLAWLTDLYIVSSPRASLDFFYLNTSWQLPFFRQQPSNDADITICKSENGN